MIERQLNRKRVYLPERELRVQAVEIKFTSFQSYFDVNVYFKAGHIT